MSARNSTGCYTQADVLPVVQLAAFAGIWGIGTLIWLPTAALATFAVLPPARRRAGVALATALLLAIPGIGVGYARLHGDDATGALRVGLVSIGGFPESHADVRGDMGRRMLAAYLAAMERLADDGAEVIVAPESALLTDSHRIDALQGFATRRGVRVPIGAEDHSAAPRKHNAALLFTPGGDSAAAYFKHHLIPGFEDRYTPGSEPLLLDGTPRLGVAICKDLDFTATGHRYGRLGAQLLLVPAWDFGVDGWMHSRMAILRSVEGGFALARSARDGALTLSDERGRLIAEASSAGRSEPVTLVATLPLRDTRTLAARLGDLPGIVALLAALLLAAPLLFTRRSAS